MADQELLREFLVSLGFQVDDPEQRKFDQAVEKSTKVVGKMAGVLGATAAAATGLVSTMATQMEKLYYMSQRSGASVENLISGGYGGKQIGLTAEAIQGAVENLARSIRSNPGVQGLIESLGVKVQGRDMSNVMTDVVKQLKSMPFYVGSQYAQMLGMDPDTFLMLSNNLDEFTKKQEESRKAMKDAGLDVEKQAAAFKEYNQGIHELEMRFTVIAAVLATKLLPYFRDFTKELNTNLTTFTKWLQNPSVGSIKHDTTRPVNTGSATADSMIRGTWFEEFLTGHRTTKQGPVSGKVTVEGGGSGGSSKVARGIRNNNPGNIEYGAFARRMGATGSDGRFAVFPTPEHGLNAMASLLRSYAAGGVGSLKGIISKWAPASENNVAAYVGSVGKSMGGVGPDADLNVGRDHRALSALMAGMIRHETGSQPYSYSQLEGAAGGKPVVIQQKTEIHVHGVNDPHAAGKTVLDGQDRVNGDLTRNLAGVVR